MQLKRI